MKTVQNILILLFTLGFLASLFVIVQHAIRSDSVEAQSLGLMVAMTGALLLVGILPNVTKLKFGPQGIDATIDRLKGEVEEQRLKVTETSAKTSETSEKLKQQQKIVNDLVIYSVAAQPYKALWDLAHLSEYKYDNTDNFRRWMYFLLDNGLIQPKTPNGWLDFNEQLQGRNLAELAKPTPAGDLLMALRREPR